MLEERHCPPMTNTFLHAFFLKMLLCWRQWVGSREGNSCFPCALWQQGDAAFVFATKEYVDPREQQFCSVKRGNQTLFRTLFWCIFSNSAQTFLLELYWWMTYSLVLKLFKTVKEVTWGRNFFRLWLNFFSALSVWKISGKHTLTTL